MALAPDVGNYYLGRGILYFDRFNTLGVKTGELDLGNCSAFSINLDTTKLEHFSSRSGLKVKDKEIVLSITATGSFTLEEYSRENLALALFGTESTLTHSSTTITNEAMSAREGRWLALLHRDVSGVVVTGAGGTPTYTTPRDYMVDAEIGRIFVKATEDGGTITAGKTLLVDYAAGAVSYKTVVAFASSEVKGYLRFVGDNPAGPNYECEVWIAGLSPAGDLNFLSEEWGKIPFNFSVEQDATNHVSEPYFRLIEH